MHARDFRKIDLVCSDNDDRPELQCVYLHEEYLYAADGYIGACIPVITDEQDTDGAIPMQAVAMARAFGSPITANETVRIEARKCTFDRPEPGRPAGFESFRKAILARPGPRPKTHEPVIILDAQRLWTLAQAICENDFPGYGVEIHLGNTAHDPVLVKPYGCHDGTLGAIMPIYLPREQSEKADLWHALDRLKAAIANGESVELRGELLAELRKVLCVEQEEKPSG